MAELEPTIDERALEAAFQTQGCWTNSYREEITVIIEAYEAALWRPIEEARMHDVDQYLVRSATGRHVTAIFWKGTWTNTWTGERISRDDLTGAMYRTSRN